MAGEKSAPRAEQAIRKQMHEAENAPVSRKNCAAAENHFFSALKCGNELRYIARIVCAIGCEKNKRRNLRMLALDEIDCNLASVPVTARVCLGDERAALARNCGCVVARTVDADRDNESFGIDDAAQFAQDRGDARRFVARWNDDGESA